MEAINGLTALFLCFKSFLSIVSKTSVVSLVRHNTWLFNSPLEVALKTLRLQHKSSLYLGIGPPWRPCFYHLRD